MIRKDRCSYCFAMHNKHAQGPAVAQGPHYVQSAVAAHDAHPEEPFSDMLLVLQLVRSLPPAPIDLLLQPVAAFLRVCLDARETLPQ